jgi:hypothetical protein
MADRDLVWRRPDAGALVALAAFISAACGGGAPRGPAFATLPELPEEPRRPDGVVVDPSPELPIAAEAVEANGGLVALKPPLPDRTARGMVTAFFRAVVGENMDAMSELATNDATQTTRARSGTPGLIDHWRARMRHFRYRAVASELLYQEGDIELYRYEDLDPPLPGRATRPPEMAPTDVLLRVPILVVRAGSDRVFGDEMLFHLRRDKRRYLIRQVIEDFQLP